MSDVEYTPKPDELIFLPLGGSSEIGMNLNLYHFAGKWLMVDLGITFGDDTTPGIEVLVPNPNYIEKHKKNLLGIFITHGHEDHIGAIPYLWERLNCPIYATPFTMSLIRRKLSDTNLLDKVEVIEVPPSKQIKLGPFSVEFVSLAHSIPDPNGLFIKCGDYSIFHTGDWKFDDNPQIGGKTDYSKLEELSLKGITAMVADSTNVDLLNKTGSEAELIRPLNELFAQQTGRIAIACFASNVARLRTIALSAQANDRHTALVGRSLWKMYEVAKEHGYLLDVPEFLSERDVGYLPNDKMVMICTGSQGEPRAALSRIAARAHPHVSLNIGDTVIFSSREIPGNELAIRRIQDRFISQGVKIVTENDAHVHVSGHPSSEEMTALYQIIKPKIAIPVHGEARHLVKHADLARSCQVPEVVVPRNGSVIKLAPGAAEEVGSVAPSVFAVDGKRLVVLDGKVIKERKKLLFNGTVTATVILNNLSLCHQSPVLSSVGIFEEDDCDLRDITHELEYAINDISSPKSQSDQFITEMVEKILRRVFRTRYEKRPVILVHVVRI